MPFEHSGLFPYGVNSLHFSVPAICFLVCGYMAQLPPYVVVDDEDDDVFIIKRLLTKAGVDNKGMVFQEPLVAIDYLEAQMSAGDEFLIPFLIFTDLKMPVMDGFEFISWVRSRPALKKTMVVMLTSSENPADVKRALAVGADKCLSKFPTAPCFRELVAAAGGTFV
jgi:CheY-like chemotaxis protein